MNLVWMRYRGSRIAHAFAELEVAARLDPVEPIARCGRYPLEDVLRDELSARCTACAHAAERGQR